jgi:uncharacterized protein (DUF1330 family)
MTAYLIVDFDIHDQSKLQEYGKGTVPLLAKLGAKVLVSGGTFEVIEGDWKPNRLAILAFEDRDAIRRFLEHPEYAELDTLRRSFCTARYIAVDGADMGSDLAILQRKP